MNLADLLKTVVFDLLPIYHFNHFRPKNSETVLLRQKPQFQYAGCSFYLECIHYLVFSKILGQNKTHSNGSYFGLKFC